MAVTLVLGASRGLGFALVEAYAAQGRSVVATVRSEADRERVEATGAKVLLVDVADPASVSGLAWQLDGEKIELALYVAGVWDAHSSATPPTREQFDRVMHTNVLGAMLGTHMALRHGTGFVRGIFIGVVSLLILKTGYDAFIA